VFAQIGYSMLIGLIGKNAILIVEFGKMEFEQKGKPWREPALEGARLRLRPILITSFAFILGCVPLGAAGGAGALGRKVLGTAVIAGMTAGTILDVFLVPVLYVVVERLSGASKKHGAPPASGATPAIEKGTH
jgi:hydrophobic/amphiphilic exporter-1 (mainly G- bacteria), HAE1 family